MDAQTHRRCTCIANVSLFVLHFCVRMWYGIWHLNYSLFHRCAHIEFEIFFFFRFVHNPKVKRQPNEMEFNRLTRWNSEYPYDIAASRGGGSGGGTAAAVAVAHHLLCRAEDKTIFIKKKSVFFYLFFRRRSVFGIP